VCVREDHEVISQGEKEAQNTLVSINRKTKEQFVLVSNFYPLWCFVFAFSVISQLIPLRQEK